VEGIPKRSLGTREWSQTQLIYKNNSSQDIIGFSRSQTPFGNAFLDAPRRTVYRKKSMGRSRYHITDNAVPYFHTCTIVGWLPIFTRPNTVQIILDSWTYLQENEYFQIHGYVILENHLHLIANSDNHREHINPLPQGKSSTI